MPEIRPIHMRKIFKKKQFPAKEDEKKVLHSIHFVLTLITSYSDKIQCLFLPKIHYCFDNVYTRQEIDY